jgi:hypothetical protein
MNNSVFSDAMACSSVEGHRCLGGRYCLRLQGTRVSQARSQQGARRYIPEYTILHIIILFKKQNLMNI